MLNYVIEPSLVLPLVPSGTELDFFEGTTYLSLVGFRFLNTRILGLRVPFHQNFEEVNLRFYVRRVERSVIRRGVVFIREIVPKRAVSAIARLAYNENYIALPMSSRINAESAEYRWKFQGCWHSIEAQSSEKAAYPSEGTHEQFIAEHYWGYSRSLEYEVKHEPWRVRTAARARFEGDATALYGEQIGRILARKPDSAFLADGSGITIFRPHGLRTVTDPLQRP